jgi:hypothetical protein
VDVYPATVGEAIPFWIFATLHFFRDAQSPCGRGPHGSAKTSDKKPDCFPISDMRQSRNVSASTRGVCVLAAALSAAFFLRLWQATVQRGPCRA